MVSYEWFTVIPFISYLSAVTLILPTPRTVYVHLFPTLLLVALSWLLEICHDGSIYIMETGNHYKSEFPSSLETWLLNVC